ncbi:beta-ketoacyl synthase N-terminal-like domain-containing protein [Actinokineospora sp. PR83]|uniref:beta-ketoacyl synthase N-terminal-like domain-containing protein n=1 Tax=Actinokineospora sp. PR83 TaxID=2884908 RepID=UPI0027E06D61|nr:beta-ketoacyl synthase N-terminal-like domain-containing protein [Actinokineospora sp. PR83]
MTGCGVISAIGQGKEAFLGALLRGDHSFGPLVRPGRVAATAFIGAEIPTPVVPERFSRKLLRGVGHSALAALVVLQEAWDDAQLAGADPERVGLVVGGSNVQQRELVLRHEAYRDRPGYLPPTYGMSYLDTDLCGLGTEQFGIRGPAHTVGGASASGQLAVIEAARLVRSGEVDACIALGALADLSHWELRALRALGAMGSDRFADRPDLASRPFDADRDGFVYGEACAAVVVERATAAEARGAHPYAVITGWAVAADGNRNPDPSVAGEARAVRGALAMAGLPPRRVDYVNPHGTGSGLGDEVEVAAIRAAGLAHARINATKSLTGHGLSAAGAVELVATLLQMRASTLHPTRNLDRPIDPALGWVRGRPERHGMTNAVTLSAGFGGLSTALCLRAGA